jgi:hypothetical protein
LASDQGTCHWTKSIPDFNAPETFYTPVLPPSSPPTSQPHIVFDNFSSSCIIQVLHALETIQIHPKKDGMVPTLVALRLIAVIGRGGVGKTIQNVWWMVSRMEKVAN